MSRATLSMTSPDFVQIIDLKDYDSFSKYYDDINEESPTTFFWFIGTRVNGVSWCQDSAEGKFLHQG